MCCIALTASDTLFAISSAIAKTSEHGTELPTKISESAFSCQYLFFLLYAVNLASGYFRAPKRISVRARRVSTPRFRLCVRFSSALFSAPKCWLTSPFTMWAYVFTPYKIHLTATASILLPAHLKSPPVPFKRPSTVLWRHLSQLALNFTQWMIEGAASFGGRFNTAVECSFHSWPRVLILSLLFL